MAVHADIARGTVSELGSTDRRWVDGDAGYAKGDDEERIDWLRVVPFIALHVAVLAVFWVGWSWTAVAVAAGSTDPGVFVTVAVNVGVAVGSTSVAVGLGLAFLQVGVVEQRLPGGQGGQRHRTGLDEGELLGLERQLVLLGHDRDALEKKRKPTFPVAVGPHQGEPAVVFLPVDLEEEAQVEKRPREQLPMTQQQSDEETPETAVAVEIGMQRLELNVEQTDAHERR